MKIRYHNSILFYANPRHRQRERFDGVCLACSLGPRFMAECPGGGSQLLCFMEIIGKRSEYKSWLMTFANGYRVAGFTPALSPQDHHPLYTGRWWFAITLGSPPHPCRTQCYLWLTSVCLNRWFTWLQVFRTSRKTKKITWSGFVCDCSEMTVTSPFQNNDSIAFILGTGGRCSFIWCLISICYALDQ